MGAGISINKGLVVFTLVSVLLLGCKEDAPAVEHVPVKELSEEERDKLQLFTETRDELNDWFDFYNLDENADTLFRLRAVWDTSLLEFPVEDSWITLYEEHPKLFEPSPDHKSILDIYTYERIFNEKRRGRVEVTAESPDSEVALVYPDDRRRLRLMFCGTPCQFHDAWWRNDHEIVVAGLIQGAGETTYYPAIWQINIYTNQIKQYTSILSAESKKGKNYLIEEVFDDL